MFKSFKFNYRPVVAVAVMIFLFGVNAFASFPSGGDVADIGNSLLNTATLSLSKLVTSLVSLLQVILGLGALVTLAIVIFKLFKGDREAAEKIAWWVAGLTIGFVLISVVQRIVLT